MIRSPQSGAARIHRVARWRDQDMLERWLASAWLLTEPNFRKILSYVATQRRAAAS